MAWGNKGISQLIIHTNTKTKKGHCRQGPHLIVSVHFPYSSKPPWYSSGNHGTGNILSQKRADVYTGPLVRHRCVLHALPCLALLCLALQIFTHCCGGGSLTSTRTYLRLPFVSGIGVVWMVFWSGESSAAWMEGLQATTKSLLKLGTRAGALPCDLILDPEEFPPSGFCGPRILITGAMKVGGGDCGFFSHCPPP